MKGEMDLQDWLEQMRQLRKMLPLTQLLEMLPGQWGQVARQLDPREVEKNFKQIEAIINSMTPEERRNPDILNASRRRCCRRFRQRCAGGQPPDEAVP